MPQTTYDPVAGILSKAPSNDSARADAWDAFHDATDEHDLTERLRKLSLPDSVKADLWDLKATGHDPRTAVSAEDFAAPSLPYRGQTVPGDTFAEKIKNAASVLGSEVVGGVKGAARSALGVGQMAINAGLVPGQTSSFMAPEFENPTLRKATDATAYSNPAEQFGGKLETAAELAAPALDVAKGTVALARSAPKLSTAALDAAEYLPVVGSTIHKARGAGKLLGIILDNTIAAAKAGPTLGDVANAGGRVVAAKEPTLTQVLTDALAEARTPEPPARITTPPPPQLPPGYTPRATVPKPKAAKMDIDTAIAQAKAASPSVVQPEPMAAAPVVAPEPIAPEPVAAPAADVPRARAYFLKSTQDIADAKAAKAAVEARKVKPKGTITPADLPEAWKSRIGQDIFPITGAEGQAVLDAFKKEIADRGLSTGQAIALVSKNKALPVQIRSQLLRALSKAGGKAAGVQ